MKTILSAVLALCMMIACSEEKKKPSPTAPDNSRLDVIGTWTGTLSLPPMGINTFFYMSLSDTDSSYTLYATDLTVSATDTVFSHAGKWTFGENAVNYYGAFCRKDSADILTPYLCESVITLGTNITNNVWTLKISDMEAVILAIGVSQETYNQAKALSINLTKQ
jgi:hypothetical protein